MDTEKTVIEPGYLGSKNGEIVYLDEKEPEIDETEIEEIIDAGGKIVFPGLINTHSHFFQSLLRGLGADLPLIDWVQQVAVPYGQKVTPEIEYFAAKLVAMESLRTGTTTITDFMYAHHLPGMGQAVIEALEEIGIRGVFIRNFHDTGRELGVPESYIEPIDKVLQDVDDLRHRVSANPLLRIWTGPSVTWGVSREGLEATVEYAEQERVPYSMHLLESEADNQSVNRRYNMSAVELLEETDFLSPSLLAVHCVKLKPEEVKRLAARGVNISYNAVSNMYLGSGIAPVTDMMDEEMTIALGTDGAASNNSQNMLETMKVSALLQKVAKEQPGIISAEDVLQMATIDGARALHWQDDIGSLEIGKRADLFVFNPSTPGTVPLHDPVATLLYSSSRDNIETTIVDGEVLYDRGRFKNITDFAGFCREMDLKIAGMFD